MVEITSRATVGQLVAERPSRARVFEELGIDYCCGGKLPLEDACAERGLDVQNVVATLREADRQSEGSYDEAAWTDAPLGELIANIVDTHHAYLRRELPRLAGLTAKVHAAHGKRHPELAEVRRIFESLRAELDAHMMKEEQILFPLIRRMDSSPSLEAAHCGSVRNPIRVMEHEHDSAGAALAQMRRLTNDFTPPADGCNTYRATLDSLAQLESDLHAHIHKENNILFPRAIELEATLARTAPAPHGA